MPKLKKGKGDMQIRSGQNELGKHRIKEGEREFRGVEEAFMEKAHFNASSMTCRKAKAFARGPTMQQCGSCW